MRRLFYISITTIIFGTAVAQQVVDATDKRAISGAIVQLLGSDKGVMRFGLTNDRGEFTIKNLEQGEFLRVSCMGYRTDTLRVSQLPKLISMEAQVTNIREVIVKAPKISMVGDTLSYNVGSYASQSDRTIGDVLKKLPGVEVETSGQIKYNGTAINKFYIEGLDMLEGRYGVATKNITPQDVAAVDIYENHQPIKALKSLVTSEQAAINLRLRDKAKAKWTGTIYGGVGAPWLRAGDVSTMAFKSKFQTINTLKGNNTGVDVTNESSQFSFNSFLESYSQGGSEPSSYITVSPTHSPDVNSRIGNNESFTSNMLLKTSDDTELKSSLVFADKRYEGGVSTETSYILSDSTLHVREDENSLELNKSASVDVTITKNSDKFYLKNTLKAELSWQDISLATAGTFPNRQLGAIDPQRYSNDLQLIRRLGRRTLSLSSFNRWATRAQRLTVERAGEEIARSVAASTFYSGTTASYGFSAGLWDFFLNGGVNVNSQKINATNLTYAKLYLAPRVQYKNRNLNISLDLPLNYFAGQQLTTASVRASAKYQFTALFSMTAAGAINRNDPDGSRYYDGLIMNNYRTFTRGTEEFLPSRSRYATVGFAYKQPISQLFFNGSVTYSVNNAPLTVSQDFIGEYIYNSYIRAENESRSWRFSGSVGKGIDALRGSASLGVSYSAFNGFSVRNGTRIDYQSSCFTLSPKFNIKPTNWLLAEYSGNYSLTALSASSTKSYFLNQSAKVIFAPTKKINFSAKGNYMINDVSELFILDSDVNYFVTGKLEISLTATNLLDRREYGYDQYVGLNFVSTRYRIRQRNVLLSARIRF